MANVFPLLCWKLKHCLLSGDLVWANTTASKTCWVGSVWAGWLCSVDLACLAAFCLGLVISFVFTKEKENKKPPVLKEDPIAFCLTKVFGCASFLAEAVGSNHDQQLWWLTVINLQVRMGELGQKEWCRQAGMKESTWSGIQNPNRSAFASGSSKLVGVLFWRWLQAKSGCKYKIAQLWLQEHSAALRTRRSSPAVEALSIICWLCTAGGCLQGSSGGSWLALRWQHL